jgi:hypothetical protein
MKGGRESRLRATGRKAVMRQTSYVSLMGTKVIRIGVLASLSLLVQHQGRFAPMESAPEFMLPDGPCSWGGTLRLIRDVPASYSAIRAAPAYPCPSPPCYQAPLLDAAPNALLGE